MFATLMIINVYYTIDNSTNDNLDVYYTNDNECLLMIINVCYTNDNQCLLH